MQILRCLERNGRCIYAAEQPDGGARRIEGSIFGDFHVTQESVQIEKRLAPVEPSGIWCIGMNYRQHAIETGMKIPDMPVVFAKGINTVQNPGDPIVLPVTAASHEVDYECELVVAIGKPCRNVNRAKALEYVLGYTCGNDVSARDWQLRWGGSQWFRGKSFDTFGPIGPVLVTKDEILNPNRLRIATVLNEQTVQDSSTSDMIFDVPFLIEFLSQSTTLLPGTLIFTGTPQGVGMAQKPPRWLRRGDRVIVAIEGIGNLENPVEQEPIT